MCPDISLLVAEYTQLSNLERIHCTLSQTLKHLIKRICGRVMKMNSMLPSSTYPPSSVKYVPGSDWPSQQGVTPKLLEAEVSQRPFSWSLRTQPEKLDTDVFYKSKTRMRTSEPYTFIKVSYQSSLLQNNAKQADQDPTYNNQIDK